MLNIVYFCISSILAETQLMCSDQHGSFLQFLDFALSRYVAQVFSEPFFQMVPVAPVITGMAFVFIFHMFCVSIVRSLCFRIFSPSFFITFLSPETAYHIGYMFLFVSSRIMLSGLMLWSVLFVYTVDSTIYVAYLHFKICLPPYCYHFT